MPVRIRRGVAASITSIKLRALPRHRRVAPSATVKGRVTIGDYTYLGGRTEIRGVLSAVEIGRYCSIGRDVKIFSSGQSHVFSGLSTYPFFSLDPAIERRHFNATRRDTVIGHDVWIGSNSIVMAGVTIGHGAVVGAASVVTKDVPPFSIVAGTPAKIIGQRFPADVQERLLDLQWWDLEFAELQRRYPRLVSNNERISVQSL